jgi:aminoglycoside phosphotransferase (APT) family kinase protein
VDNLVRTICRIEGLPALEIRVLSGGQVNRVFLVDRAFVVRIGGREDAFERLRRETELLRSLAGKIPVPGVHAFGVQESVVYQIQQFIPGRKLYAVWKELRPDEQDSVAAQLGAHLRVIHGLKAPYFGSAGEETRRCTAWSDYRAEEFSRTLDEIRTLNIRMAPGFIEMAKDYFDEHRHVLQDGVPTLVHGDLSLVNILVHEGKITALLDFEYALQAPPDYELWVPEAFCLYPNDWAEEDNEVFSSADFANFFPLLQKHYPALFEIPNLRQRLNLYQIESALRNYLSWRIDNLDTIPPEKMAAKEFYMARITNFIFRNGARTFFGK